jgi:uroporphyrinogen decarboxylase
MPREKISHRERIQTTLEGKKADHIPAVLWRHFPVDDQTPDALAAATAVFQDQYQWDIIKVTPSSSYCLRDWGSLDEWRGDTEGTRDYSHFPISSSKDWLKITRLNPHKSYLRQQLECLKLLKKRYSPDTPIIQTIFSPLAQAKNLVNRDALLVHIRSYPDEVLKALAVISQTTKDFIESCNEIGIDGIFYAVQFSQAGLVSKDEFLTFSKQFDTQLLKSAELMWIRLLHIHGTNIFFDSMLDYPINILNWHDRSTSPSIAESRKLYKGVICGGLGRIDTLVLGDSTGIHNQAREAFEMAGQRNFILGTGCVVPMTASYGNLMAVHDSAALLRPI